MEQLWLCLNAHNCDAGKATCLGQTSYVSRMNHLADGANGRRGGGDS